MEWFVDNWYLIVAFVCVICAVTSCVINFILLPNDQKVKNIKEWLKYAVIEAEKQLGGGTGQLKLRMVYDMAVEKFPWLIKMVSFDTFSKWVDEALEWMRIQLESNTSVKNIVEG